jgi:hypothetical protein
MLHRHQELIRTARDTARKLRRIAANSSDADLAVELKRMAEEEDIIAIGLENALTAEEA